MSRFEQGTGNRRLLVVDPCGGCADLFSALGDVWQMSVCGLAEAHLQQFDVGILRLHAHQLSSLESIKRLIADSGSEWIAVVNSETLHDKNARDFIGGWFFDYHTLPLDFFRLKCVLGRAFGMAHLRGHRGRMPSRSHRDRLVGQSPQIESLRKRISKLAVTESTVLVLGESGTGKELIARALHEQSRRNAMPFVAINCGAIPEHLIQSELFGHEKGAFTGAHQRKIGRIEAADDGTLFLDEVGDLPLAMQVNLLRFLQEKTIERVGGSSPIELNVRVIAATHIDLERAVSEGRFREDLYYRLNVMDLETTPLREQKGDIALLAQYFSDYYADEIGRRPKGFSSAAIATMAAHDWPGNVRELANRVRRAQALAEGRQLQPVDLGLESEGALATTCFGSLKDYLGRAERQALEDVMATQTRSMSDAAKALGVSRPTLYRLLHKHRML